MPSGNEFSHINRARRHFLGLAVAAATKVAAIGAAASALANLGVGPRCSESAWLIQIRSVRPWLAPVNHVFNHSELCDRERSVLPARFFHTHSTKQSAPPWWVQARAPFL